MEAIEIAIYIVIALMLGAMVISFVANTDTISIHDQLKSLFFPEKNKFDRIGRDQLPMVILELWKECGYGLIDANYTIYAYDDKMGTQDINHTTLFEYYQKFNLCNSLRSESEGCGTGENVEIWNASHKFNATITGSNILRIFCNATSRNLTITTRFG
jgi:hypothetical protein